MGPVPEFDPLFDPNRWNHREWLFALAKDLRGKIRVVDLNLESECCGVNLWYKSRKVLEASSRFLSFYIRHGGSLRTRKGWGQAMDGGGWMSWAQTCTDCMLDRCRGK